MQGEDGQYREGLGFALWALWIAGLAGIHRIYLGKYGTGILYLLTFGLFQKKKQSQQREINGRSG